MTIISIEGNELQEAAIERNTRGNELDKTLLPKFCEPTGVTSYEWKNGGDRKDFGL